jgi:hypothetical protein
LQLLQQSSCTQQAKGSTRCGQGDAGEVMTLQGLIDKASSLYFANPCLGPQKCLRIYSLCNLEGVGCLVPSWDHLKTVFDHLGAILKPLGSSSGIFGPVPSCAIFGPSWGCFQAVLAFLKLVSHRPFRGQSQGVSLHLLGLSWAHFGRRVPSTTSFWISWGFSFGASKCQFCCQENGPHP